MTRKLSPTHTICPHLQIPSHTHLMKYSVLEEYRPGYNIFKQREATITQQNDFPPNTFDNLIIELS